MSTFERNTEGYPEHVNVPDSLDAYHEARGWVKVVPHGDGFLPVDVADAIRFADAERAELEAQAASLAGADLEAAVKAAKVAHPSSLSAAEKRAALVDAQLDPADVADLDDVPAPHKES